MTRAQTHTDARADTHWRARRHTLTRAQTHTDARADTQRRAHHIQTTDEYVNMYAQSYCETTVKRTPPRSAELNEVYKEPSWSKLHNLQVTIVHCIVWWVYVIPPMLLLNTFLHFIWFIHRRSSIVTRNLFSAIFHTTLILQIRLRILKTNI